MSKDRAITKNGLRWYNGEVAEIHEHSPKPGLQQERGTMVTDRGQKLPVWRWLGQLTWGILGDTSEQTETE